MGETTHAADDRDGQATNNTRLNPDGVVDSDNYDILGWDADGDDGAYAIVHDSYLNRLLVVSHVPYDDALSNEEYDYTVHIDASSVTYSDDTIRTELGILDALDIFNQAVITIESISIDGTVTCQNHHSGNTFKIDLTSDKHPLDLYDDITEVPDSVIADLDPDVAHILYCRAEGRHEEADELESDIR